METLCDSAEKNDFIQVAGELGDNFTYIYTAFGKKYYEISVKVPRLSGEIDEVITRVSESCCNTLRNIAGNYVQITGQLRVYPKEADGHKSALLRVYAKELQVIPPCTAETNQVILIGFICKPPVYRTTPLNRKITDLIVAVNRQYGENGIICKQEEGRRSGSNCGENAEQEIHKTVSGS